MRLPVVLDCGTNNLADPFYISRLQKRVRGEKCEQLVDDFTNAAKTKIRTALQRRRPGNGPGRARWPAGPVPLPGKPISERKFGAGTVGTGIVDLIAQAISRETGKTVEESRKQI
ncbi:hypothetical protein PF005_g20866 [Phytophthora fragariae]|uniref:Malic enzyme N-terminal domain-containing protein n=1 Tax=Phytophthora fragariae TaxID=53985 RepID=A0A6A3WJJ3_9STRA|nr:hypothetical protein PF003_g6162 [Phytophthora fragariae]KAE8927956.1 hypothetical protein PF009_g21882 [Phytophthora fragariae]KAE8987274.1 hypothetical protein PF011_g19642 [Phytophthora fragariae]KAE9085824.1 hypothetical protein PF010_g20319 [Phytophthora fragariae]KAE9085939.1 hypothetical protein PF007_g20956 [Phytophthora fragariae]